jgi:uncharacterized protein (TIGR02466 family)
MPFSEPEVRVMFPVPLVTMHLKDAAKLNRRLLKEVAKRRETEPGIERSNRYGWHSATDLFKRTEPAHAELSAQIHAMVVAASAKIIPDLPETLQIRHEGWINVSPTHALNAPHDHPGVFWSGTYYIRVPMPADSEDKLSGAIEFIDPRGSIGTNARVETPFTRSKFTARPAEGALLLWPGFVRHWVHPNRADDERVTASFNSWFTRSGP